MGFSLLQETADGGVQEIPSIDDNTVIAEQVVVPVDEQPEVSNVSVEELVEFKHDIMKSEGVNKDFAVSMEAMVPGILGNNGLYLNGYSECLSKINFNQTVKALDVAIGKAATGLTVSQEDAFDPAIVGESITDTMKGKWNADKKVYEDLTEDELQEFGKIIAYKIFHNVKNGHAVNELYNTVLSGAGEISYVNGTPILSANPAFQAPSTVSDVQPEVIPTDAPVVTE